MICFIRGNMNRCVKTLLIPRNRFCHVIKRRCNKQDTPKSSALFASHAYTDNISLFNTNMILDEKCVLQSEGLRENLKRRNIEFDVDGFLSQYSRLRGMVQVRNKLHKSRKDINRLIDEFRDRDGGNSDFEKLISERRALATPWKELNATWWALEEEVFMKALWLPNTIHPLTPDNFTVLHRDVNTVGEGLDHVFIGQKDRLIKFSNVGRKAYYLFKMAAELEYNLLSHVDNVIEKASFIPMSTPDFCRSPVIEGCGVNFENTQESLLLKGDSRSNPKFNDNHFLVGASVKSLLSFFTKMRLSGRSNPISVYSKGSTYLPIPSEVSNENCTSADEGIYSSPSYEDELTCSHIEPSLGLYEALQVQTCQAAVVGMNREQGEQSYESLICLTKQIYSDLHLPFRVVRVPANSLHLSECLRTDFQIYSPVIKKYITAGYVSYVADFISRRLEITHDGGYCYLSHACLFDATKAVASFIERYYNTDLESFSLPTDLRYLLE